MTDHSVARRFVVGAFAVVSTGGALLGVAGTASASPVPGIPFTSAGQCTGGGGQVATVAPGAQRCEGGGDHGDVVVPDAVAQAMASTIPRPPIPGPALPG